MLQKRTVFTEFRAHRPKLCGNCAFPQHFYARKLGKISVFGAVDFDTCCYQNGFKPFLLTLLILITKCYQNQKLKLLHQLQVLPNIVTHFAMLNCSDYNVICKIQSEKPPKMIFLNQKAGSHYFVFLLPTHIISFAIFMIAKKTYL